MAIPSLAMIPTGFKDGKLYSVLPESGAGDFSVDRASNATRVNSSGLIESVGNNVPILDYTGGGCPVLSTEPQSTNLVPYSEDFTEWSKTQTIVESASVTLPNGLTNGYKLFANTTPSVGHWMEVLPFPTATIGQAYTISLFVKSAGSDFIQIAASTGLPSKYQNFNISTGAKASGNATSSSITDFGNGWFRISVTETTTGTSARYLVVPILSDVGRNAQFAGTAEEDGAYVFGAQVEEKSFATSYIPTSGAIATRLQDKVTGAGDVNTFNSTEGVLYLEGSAFADGNVNRKITLSDGTSANRVTIFYNATNQLRAVVRAGSVNVLSSTRNVDITQMTKVAIKWSQDSFELWVNGVKQTSVTSGNTFPANNLNDLAFAEYNGTQPYHGKTKDLRVFNTALSDAELTELTTI